MAQPVIIKSFKNGINLILDPDISFDELLAETAVKFRESASFFKNARMAVSFSGRELSRDEEKMLVSAITAFSDIKVICVAASDDRVQDKFRRDIDSYYNATRARGDQYYRGTLYAGQTLESESTIILVGDVEAGAKIVSQKNVIVMGALRGIACAGGLSDNEAFVVAVEMEPSELRIGKTRKRFPESTEKKAKGKLMRKKELPQIAEPKVAHIVGEEIIIESAEKGIIDRI